MRNIFRALLSLGFLGLLVCLERRRPLRPATESKLRRNSRNLAAASLAAATVQFVEKPVVQPLSKIVERRRWGLLQLLESPRWLEITLGVVLLDYTPYIWHILTHRVPLLWRFHAVHHVDLDLDASTALRFHFGELALAVTWRAGQIIVIGISPASRSAWQTALSLSILFHHSNVRLPIQIEQQLSRFVVTPRMHGIHHSTSPEEVNSNWSSGLSAWDHLHGTIRLDVPQNEITIGVPGFRRPEQVTLPKILVMPFQEDSRLEPIGKYRLTARRKPQFMLSE